MKYFKKMSISTLTLLGLLTAIPSGLAYADAIQRAKVQAVLNVYMPPTKACVLKLKTAIPCNIGTNSIPRWEAATDTINTVVVANGVITITAVGIPNPVLVVAFGNDGNVSFTTCYNKEYCQ